MQSPWPALPLAEWRDTCDTLHLWTQIVGKIRLSLTPWLNHSWHTTLYVTPRGLTTSTIPYENNPFEIEFDFIAHDLVIHTASGETRRIKLRPIIVAAFYAEVMAALAALKIEVRIHTMPNEVADPIALDRDTTHGAYDSDAANRFWRVLLASDRVFKLFRTAWLGKASPVHFFWGSFDLAVTRFSGRPAPRHPGGVPGLPDAVTREAYSHEVSSAGFWPGGGAIDYPAFYAYAYPVPPGFSDAKVRPDAAFFSPDLGEFILPYDAVRMAADPDAMLLEFLQSTYEAAAITGGWDRGALECGLGKLKIPRATKT